MLKKVCFPFLKNNFFLIPRDGVLLLFKYCSARVRFFLIPRDVVVLLFNYYTARVRLCVFPYTLSFRAKPRNLVETNAAV